MRVTETVRVRVRVRVRGRVTVRVTVTVGVTVGVRGRVRGRVTVRVGVGEVLVLVKGRESSSTRAALRRGRSGASSTLVRVVL